MKIEDIKKIAGLVMDAVLDGLLPRIQALESRELIPGPAGKDADPEAIKSAVEEVVKGLPAPKDGEPGKDGCDGADGKDGRDGMDGKSITEADVKDLLDRLVEQRVANIPAGKDGKSLGEADILPLLERLVDERMAKIPVAKDGADGRDALALEIMPAIDEARSFSRGSYATHRGGLWRSFERTEGMRGWECLVDGVAALSIEAKSDREFTVIAELASGGRVEKAVALPVMIYRGIYAAGGEYAQGDTVTWAGSLWYAGGVPEGKPGEPASKGWILAAKRGRDGKDGRDGRDMTKGVPAK